MHYFPVTTNDGQTKGKENGYQLPSGYNVNTPSIKRIKIVVLPSMIIPITIITTTIYTTTIYLLLLCLHETCVKHLAATYNNAV